MTDNEKFLDEWESIVNSVDKTNIPIRFVNKIIFESEFYDASTSSNTSQLDIASLRGMGYPDDVITEILENIISEFKNRDGTMDFLLNIEEIARVVQTHTDKYIHRE